jgi:hypothetical protein
MSLFSLPSVLRRSVPSDGSDNAPAVRPSVVSASHLNAQLLEEAQHVDQHLFFGPQQTVFDGERQRVIHGERKVQKNSKRFWLMSEPLSMDRDSTTSLIGFPTDPPTRPSGLGSKVTAATRFIGQKVAQMKFPPSHVNEDSFCDGCGMDPIVGNMYSCSKCVNYSLCESCYQLGIHGFEDSKLLLDVREDFALRKVMEVCKNKVPEEVFTVLLKTVCRGQVDHGRRAGPAHQHARGARHRDPAPGRGDALHARAAAHARAGRPHGPRGLHGVVLPGTFLRLDVLFFHCSGNVCTDLLAV